jgi:MFS family permease
MENRKVLQNNIIKFYFSQFFDGLQFTGPIFVLFLLSNNLTFAQVAILSSIQAIIIGFFEIPSGTFADLFGKKRALIFAGIMGLIGSIVYAFNSSFTAFIVADIAWALFLSFRSGADSAWLYDTLKNLKQENNFKKINGKGTLIKGTSLFLSQGAITFFAVKDYRIAFFLMIPVSILILLTFLTYKEPEDIGKKQIRNIKYFLIHTIDSFKIIIKNKFLNCLFIFLILESIIGSTYYFLLLQPYLKSIKYPIVLLGILWAVTGLLTSIGAYFSDPIERKLGKKIIMYTAPIIIFLPIFILGLTNSLGIAISSIIFAQFTIGIYYVIFEDYIHKEVESSRRATILSSKNFLRNIFLVIFYPLIGLLADKMSLHYALLIPAGIAIFISYLLLTIYRKEIK